MKEKTVKSIIENSQKKISSDVITNITENVMDAYKIGFETGLEIGSKSVLDNIEHIVMLQNESISQQKMLEIINEYRKTL